MKKSLRTGIAIAIALFMMGGDAFAQRSSRTTTRKTYRKTYKVKPRNPNAATPVPGAPQVLPPGEAKKDEIVIPAPKTKRHRKVVIVPAPPPGNIPSAPPPPRPVRTENGD